MEAVSVRVAEMMGGLVAAGQELLVGFDKLEFVTGFLVTAGWLAMVAEGDEDAWRAHLASVGVSPRNGMQEGVAVLDLISDDALRWLVGEAEEFVAFNRDDLRAAVAAGRDDAWLGHDFLLSRCGHGSGFWDRGLGELGDRLHAAAKVFGDVVIEVFLGDDGWEALVS